MSVHLNITIDTPLDEDDRGVLAGLGIMVLALGNHDLAEDRFPEVFPLTPVSCPREGCEWEGPAMLVQFHEAWHQNQQPEPEGAAAPVEGKCNALETNTGYRCVSDVGHKGRHRFRDVIGAAVNGDLPASGVN